MNDKDFFKAIKKEGKEYSEEMHEAFPYFCLKIFWDGLSGDEIKDALYGLRTNDESVDAFIVDEENKETHIIQCKSCKSEKKKTTLKKEWLAYLAKVESTLQDHDYIDKHKNTTLKEIAAKLSVSKEKGFKLKLHFFHLGEAGNKDVIEHYEGKIKYYDTRAIKEQYKDYHSKIDRTEPPEINIQLHFACIEPNISNSKHHTLVSVITGDEIIALREKHRYRLFDKNLRFALGKNKINKGISKTALEEPSNFYFYNNGLTITSKAFKYKPTNSSLRVEYPQIINGAQTVDAIYQAYLNRVNTEERKTGQEGTKERIKNEFKKISILFRIIQDNEKDGKKTSDFEEKVTRYNNSQNSIKETDFYANNQEQLKIQEHFAKHGYFYETKRGDRKYLEEKRGHEHNLLKKKKGDFRYWSEKIDIEKLASLWMAYKYDPSKEQLKKSNIFGHANDKNYNKLFDFARSEDEEDIDEIVKEMIFAFNLLEIIITQTDIYGNSSKSGQIVSKMKGIKADTENADKILENINKIIQRSFLFYPVMKNECSESKSFFENQKALIKQVEDYQFIPQGRYLILAAFGKVIRECDYTKEIISKKFFLDKGKIEKGIVSPWLRKILDKLIKKEYDDFAKGNASRLQVFYTRNSTWENIEEERFNDLKYNSTEENMKGIFPLSTT